MIVQIALGIVLGFLLLVRNFYRKPGLVWVQGHLAQDCRVANVMRPCMEAVAYE